MLQESVGTWCLKVTSALMMEISLRTAQASMPLYRELFSDVLCKRLYGNIHQLWHFPGHVMVTTNEGRKLFTFSCIPISAQQAFEQKSLDIPSLPTPLLDCIELHDGILALIDTQGAVKLWKFTENFAWQPWGDLTLCQTNSADIISVAFMPGTREFVWCEQRQLPSFSSNSPQQYQYCVCRKQIPDSFTSTKLTDDTSQSSILIYNIPCCDLYAISQDTLIVATKYKKSQVSVYSICDLHEASFTLFVAEDTSTLSIGDGVNFKEALLGLLSSLVKAELGKGDCGVKVDDTEGHASVLSSTGVVDVFSCISGPNKKQVTKRKVQLSDFSLNGNSPQLPCWFMHSNLIGVVAVGVLSVFSLTGGHKLCTACLDQSVQVQMVVPSRSPAFLAWILSANQLYSVQAKDLISKEILSTPDKLPDDQLIQMDILRLARLQQRKLEGYNLNLSEELDQLKLKWEEKQGVNQQGEVSQILAPFIDEYWRLEKLSKALLESDKQVLEPHPINTPKALVSAVMESRTIGRSVQHAKLLWLSQVYPRDLLDYLCQGINFTSDAVDQNQLRQWQTLIGLDGGDLLNFEFVCRLLFHLEPDKLLPFVQCAESVSEQAVGVSAFIRKKNSLIYCKAACECLPDCQSSVDPKMAASSKAKLLWASECENREERSLKCYLQHNLWEEAIALLREVDRQEKARESDRQRGETQGRNKEGKKRQLLLPTLLHVTVTVFTQNQVLEDYIEELFRLMPSWKSIVSLAKVAACKPEIRQQQLTTSAEHVFVTNTESGVPLSSVRTQLLGLIKHMSDT